MIYLFLIAAVLSMHKIFILSIKINIKLIITQLNFLQYAVMLKF